MSSKGDADLAIVTHAHTVPVVEAVVHRPIEKGEVIVPGNVHVPVQDHAIAAAIGVRVESRCGWYRVVVHLHQETQMVYK